MADILKRQPLPDNIILDEEDVAELLRCVPDTVCRSIPQEELPFCKIGKQKITLSQFVVDFVRQRCRQGCRRPIREMVSEVEADVLNSAHNGVPRRATRSKP